MRDLEELTGLAFALLRKLGQPDIGQRCHLYVPALFKALALNADSVLRLHPLSVFYSDAGEPVWNPIAITGLARSLMETCADLYYFAGREVGEDEREFRGIIADVQRARERIRMADLMARERAAGKAPLLPKPSTAWERDRAWVDQRRQQQVPDQLAFWLEQLEANGHFTKLSAVEKEAWRTGDFPRRTRRHQRNGYALSRTDRARAAGIPAWVHAAVYGRFSEYTHTSAAGLDRIFWFHSFDRVAIESQISLPVGLCCAFVAHAALEFTEVFPLCKGQLSLELWLLLSRCRNHIARPGGGDAA